MEEIINQTLKKRGAGERVHDFHFKKRLGKGAQGQVFLVQIEGTDGSGNKFNKNFALKKCPKEKYEQKSQKQALMLEN